MTIRDMLKGSPTYGDFVMWVGTYDDIIHARPGQCRVRLLDNQTRPGDTGYAVLELLPDGTFFSTTYYTLEKDQNPVVVSIRFKMDEIDKELTSQADLSRSGRDDCLSLEPACLSMMAPCDGVIMEADTMAQYQPRLPAKHPSAAGAVIETKPRDLVSPPTT
jgi:hypothetical protein